MPECAIELGPLTLLMSFDICDEHAKFNVVLSELTIPVMTECLNKFSF